MKKISSVMIAAFVAMSATFVSCTDDDDNPFADPTIEVKLTPGGGSTIDLTKNQTLDAYETGERLDFAIRFKMGDDKLTSIKIVAKIGSDSFTEVDSTLNEGWLNSGDRQLDYKYGTSVGNNEKTITFSTIDKKNRSESFSVTIKPKAGSEQGGNFTTSRATLMGAHKNTAYGSFYSVDMGEVFMLGAANTNQGKIDFAYFYGAQNEATIGAPDNADVQTMFPSVKNWSTKNDTKFYLVSATSLDFASVDVPWFDAEIEKATTNTAANKLVRGNVIAYKTKSGKTGMFEVESLSTGSTGTITIKLVTKNP